MASLPILTPLALALLAQGPAPQACPAQSVLSPPFMAWSEPPARRGPATADPLPIATPVIVNLAKDVGGQHSGTFALTIGTAGTYRVALESAAWIDLERDAAKLTSVGHGHGPDCSGIRKYVDFTLRPGTYQLHISRSESPATRILIVRAS